MSLQRLRAHSILLVTFVTFGFTVNYFLPQAGIKEDPLFTTEVESISGSETVNSTVSVNEPSASINPMRRMLECIRLQSSPTRRSFARLAKLTFDQNPVVRAHAISALANFTTPEAIHLLAVKLRTGDWRERRCAANALSGFSTGEARKALIEAMHDESPMVRQVAKKALDSSFRTS